LLLNGLQQLKNGVMSKNSILSLSISILGLFISIFRPILSILGLFLSILTPILDFIIQYFTLFFISIFGRFLF